MYAEKFLNSSIVGWKVGTDGNWVVHLGFLGGGLGFGFFFLFLGLCIGLVRDLWGWDLCCLGVYEGLVVLVSFDCFLGEVPKPDREDDC